MSKVGQDILKSVEELTRHARGEDVGAEEQLVRVPVAVDVKAIRARTGLSQREFCRRYGVVASTLRDWEQGRRKPDVAARALLTIIDREPEAVERALND